MRTVLAVFAGVAFGLSGVDAADGVEIPTAACPSNLEVVEDSLTKLRLLSDGDQVNHVDPSAYGPARLATDFEWYAEWTGDGLRAALNSIRDQVPVDVLGFFDDFVDAAVEWVERDKSWLTTIDVISKAQFDAGGPYSYGFWGDLYFRAPANDTTGEKRYRAWERYLQAQGVLNGAIGFLPGGEIALNGATLASTTVGLTCDTRSTDDGQGEQTNGAVVDASELSDEIESGDLGSMSNEELFVLISDPAFARVSRGLAEDVFEALDVDSLTSEDLAVLSDIPQAVKRVFEKVVDVYGSGLDDYLPAGSRITVSARRTVIAVSVLLSATAMTGTSPLGGRGVALGGGGARAGRREDEGAQQGAADLKGPGYRTRLRTSQSRKSFKTLIGARGHELSPVEFTRNSIYRYASQDGRVSRRLSIAGLSRKLLRETSAVAFTLAGSIIVIGTLSGVTRSIAIVATVTAALLHFGLVVVENDVVAEGDRA